MTFLISEKKNQSAYNFHECPKDGIMFVTTINSITAFIYCKWSKDDIELLKILTFWRSGNSTDFSSILQQHKESTHFSQIYKHNPPKLCCEPEERTGFGSSQSHRLLGKSSFCLASCFLDLWANSENLLSERKMKPAKAAMHLLNIFPIHTTWGGQCPWAFSRRSFVFCCFVLFLRSQKRLEFLELIACVLYYAKS